MISQLVKVDSLKNILEESVLIRGQCIYYQVLTKCWKNLYTTHFIMFTEEKKEKIDHGNFASRISVDLHKAFGKLLNEILIQKLNQ